MTVSEERDVQCGLDFARLVDLGCFDEEFVLYGCAFFEAGNSKYLISGDKEKIYQLHEHGYLHGRNFTPIIRKIQRRMVGSGQRDDIRQQLKVELAKDLQRRYCPIFFQELDKLTKVPANNQAYLLLQQEQERLDGRFQADDTLLFEGLCKLSIESKVLTEKSYDILASWMKYVRKQMEDDIIIKDKFERSFSGFAYEKENGQIGYFFDAQKVNVLERKAKYETACVFTTPIFTKRYWFHTLNQLPKTRKSFENLLKDKINANYIAKVKAIKGMPSAIPKELYWDAEQRIQENCSEEAWQVFRMYGYRWNL